MHILQRGSPDYGRTDSGEYDARRWRGSSPTWNGVKRKRSVSPPDRYVRSRYDDHPHYDRDRYSRSNGGRAFSPERRGPPDPASRDTLATFRQYSEWFKYMYPDEWQEEPTVDRSNDTQSDKVEVSIVRTRYEEYRRNFIRKQYRNMFDYHRKFAWFLEKYDMADRYVDMRDRVRQQGWRGRIAHFIEELEGGKFDPMLPGQEPSVQATRVRGDDDESSNHGDSTQATSASQPTPGEHMVAPTHPQLLIRTLPPDIGRLKLEEVLVTLSGFKYVAIGDPVQKRQFYRSGWIAFEDEDDLKRALTELESKKIDNFRLPVSHIAEPFKAKIRYTPAAANKPSRMEKDLEQAKKLVVVLEAQAAEVAAYKPVYPVGAPPSAEAPQPETAMEDVKTEEIDPTRGSKAVEERVDKLASETLDTDENGNPDKAKWTALALDMYLSYLREAFNCCYYCALVTDHQEELVRKCIKHERREDLSANQQGENGETKDHANGNSESPSDERWADSLDHKLACLIDPTGVDPKNYGGSSLEDERTRLTAPHMSKEDEGKWRCHDCKKLFKASEFVEKHVMNKHAELVKPQVDEWELYNNFILDPQRITPMQAVPLNTSGVAQHPPQAFGLPPEWRSSYGSYDRNNRDHRDRDRRPSYSRRSPSPVSFNKPIRFTIDADTSSITVKGVNGSVLPPIPGLPAKPVGAMAPSVPTPTTSSSGLLERMSAPPPPGQRPDPRARISYHDLDMADSSEDVALNY